MLAQTSDMTLKSREAIFEDMAEVTRHAALEGARKITAGYKIALMVQYDLGSIVNQVHEDAALNEHQKRNEIRKLAAYWNQPNLNPTTLYDLRNVSAAFSRDFVQSQVEERMANGLYLTWSHFKELQKIGDEKKQLAVLKKIRQHCWSANELALELQGKKEAAIQRSGGRKPLLPKTPNAMMQKLYTTTQLADNYVAALAEPLESTFLEMAPAEIDSQFVENVSSTKAKIEEAIRHFQETVNRLDKVMHRAQKVVTTSATMAAKQAAAEPELEEYEEEAPAPVVERKLPRRASVAR